MKTLHFCGKIEVRESPIEGFGVFATTKIEKNEVLEETPFVLFPRHTNLAKTLFDTLSSSGYISEKEKYLDNLRTNLKFKDPEKYYFKWLAPSQLGGEQITYTVLPLGFGPIYNTANYDNNAGWIVKDKTFQFIAVRDIEPEEEIRTFYGYFLGEDGSIFNCQAVYNMAVESIDGFLYIRSLRFQSDAEWQRDKNDPGIYMLLKTLEESNKKVKLVAISRMSASSAEEDKLVFVKNTPISFAYNRIATYRASKSAFTKFYVEKENGENVEFAIKNNV